MQIVFEGTPLFGQKAGIYNYYFCLIDAMLEFMNGNKIVLFYPHFLEKFCSRPEFNRECEYISYKLLQDVLQFQWHPGLPVQKKAWNKLIRTVLSVTTEWNLKRLIKNADIFHWSYFKYFTHSRARNIATVHDITTIIFPEFHSNATIKLTNSAIFCIRDNADRIIAVSNTTKDDLVRTVGVEPERIDVVYEGCSKRYRVIENPQFIKRVTKKYGIGTDPYILCVATLEPRKNLLRLLKAFEVIGKKMEKINLVIAGDRRWGSEKILSKITESNFANRIILTGYVNPNDLPVIYNATELFVYPSLYEGFGLPPLEAMACGTPVVTSNLSSLPEVVGDAAVLVDPYNVESIARGILKVLKDKELRENLIRKGFERVKIFSWEKTARETLSVYKKACEDSR